MTFLINIILIVGIIYAILATSLPIQATMQHIFGFDPSVINTRESVIQGIPYFLWIVAGIYVLKIIAWAILITTYPIMIVPLILLYSGALAIAWLFLEKDRPNRKLFMAGRLAFITDIVLSILILAGITI